MDFLKDIFGTEPLTFDQFAQKCSEKKLNLADLSTGAYVSKDKFTALELERNGLKTRLNEADTKLAGYDPEWKSKAEAAEKEAARKISEAAFGFKLDAKIAALKGRSATSIKAELGAETLEKLRESQNQDADVDAALAGLQKEKAFLFESAEKPPRFVAGSTGSRDTGVTAKDKANEALRGFFGQ